MEYEYTNNEDAEIEDYMNTWLPTHYRVVGDGPALPGNIELHTTFIDDFYLDSVKWK